jgi:hypothetical protein
MDFESNSARGEPGMVAQSVILALRRLRQEDHEFEASLGCIHGKTCLKKKTKTKNKTQSTRRGWWGWGCGSVVESVLTQHQEEEEEEKKEYRKKENKVRKLDGEI